VCSSMQLLAVKPKSATVDLISAECICPQRDYRCQVKIGTPEMGTPDAYFHMKLGTPMPIFT